MLRPIIIGQAPARGNDQKPPFSGRSGARLARLTAENDRLDTQCYSGDVLPSIFELRNIFGEWPGKASGKGDEFDPATARIIVRETILPWLAVQNPRQILLMGHKVAKAFGVGEHPYLEWFSIMDELHQVAVFPHPSGVNHWWNSRANYVQARRFMTELLSHNG